MTEKELAEILRNNDQLSADGFAPSPSATVQAARRNKYNAKRTEVDDIVFASAAEARRYSELKLCEMAGEISNLKRQVRFPIHVNATHISDYIADFTYYQDGRYVVEDVKSEPTKTPVYLLKKKLVEALYKLIITEVR